MSDPIIVLAGLTKTYGDLVAVRDSVFEIQRGEIFGFLGANGAGKTTTMRMLCGLVRPTIGARDDRRRGCLARSLHGAVEVRLHGAKVQSLSRPDRRRKHALFCRRLPRSAPANWQRESSGCSLLHDLEAKRDTPAGSLSGGMRQLLALGCALVHEPPLLFLDEPTSGLDPVHRQQMWNLLYDLSHDGSRFSSRPITWMKRNAARKSAFSISGALAGQGAAARVEGQLQGALLELEVEPVMEALVRLRETPGILGVSLRSGSLRLYAPDARESARGMATGNGPFLRLATARATVGWSRTWKMSSPLTRKATTPCSKQELCDERDLPAAPSPAWRTRSSSTFIATGAFSFSSSFCRRSSRSSSATPLKATKSTNVPALLMNRDESPRAQSFVE